MKETTSKKPLEFPTFEFSEIYSTQIPSQSTPHPTYTSSPKTLDQHKGSSLNKVIQGVTPKEPLYRIPNTKVNQLCHHTRAYLKSIGQIPIIYQMPRSRASQKRTQYFSDDETLTPSIDDLMIDTILETRQPIPTIAQSETQEDPKFHNFLYFPEGDSTFYDFLEAQAGVSEPPKPLERNPPCTNIPTPISNFNFEANIEANRPWLVVDAIAVPGALHSLSKHPEKLLQKFDLDNDVSLEDHIKLFMLSLRLMDVEDEDFVCRLFP